MTQEDKELLLKDLCARLPYKPVVHAKWSYRETNGETKYKEADRQLLINDFYDIWGVVPYLRPMSSMTEEEYKDLCNSCTWLWFEDDLRTVTHGDYKCYDWLTVHHFDYRGLIPKGLALEAPEGMYKQ